MSDSPYDLSARGRWNRKSPSERHRSVTNQRVSQVEAKLNELLCTKCESPGEMKPTVNHPSNRVETAEQIEALFMYHSLTEAQAERSYKIDAAAKALALVILEHCPGCADRTDAIRKVREAWMTANAAIECETKE